MNIGEFLKFCLDFKVPLSKHRIIDVFKRLSKNHREIGFEEFRFSPGKLWEAVREEKV